MSRARLLSLGALAVALVVVVVLLLQQSGPNSAGSAERPASPDTTKATAVPGLETAPSSGASSELAPVEAQGEGVGGGKASTSASASPSGLPGLTKVRTGPLVKKPPSRAVRRGGLVPGYPARVGVVPHSRITSSSVSPSPGRLQVALDARVRAGADDVLRWYAVRLSRSGFVSKVAPATGGAQAATYGRGKDSLVVTVTPAGHGVVGYTVFGTLRTSGGKG